ncbi:hypothetical protein CVT24_010596, partial [Panaeolus cyanescens]
MSISIDSTASLTTAVLKYAPQPISAAVTEIMQTLSPLINTVSSLDEDIKKSLRDFRERFVQAVRYMRITIKHTLVALNMLTPLMVTFGTQLSPSSTESGLRLVAESFLYGNACATDAYEQYKALRRDVESQFELLFQRFGEESVIEVAEISKTTKSTLKALRATITTHLHESEKTASATVDILTGVNTLIRAFLEDKDFSLRDVMITFEMGFTLDPAETRRELEEDRQARKGQIPEVQIKLPRGDASTESGALDSGFSLPDSPRKLISVRIPKSSGVCTIYVERSEDPRPGTTGVRAIFVIPVPHKGSGLKSICVNAVVKPTSSSSASCSLNNRSTTVEETKFEPQNCKPIFSTNQPSKSTLQWMFLRPFLRLRWK